MEQIKSTAGPIFSYATHTKKLDQLEKVVYKEWGHEEWIINNEKYCGKRLIFMAGFQCSMHYHKIKDETFYIQSGLVILETERNGIYNQLCMRPGDVMNILPMTWHRIIALEDAEVFEFSTLHMEEDSYRRTTSGKVDTVYLSSLMTLMPCNHQE